MQQKTFDLNSLNGVNGFAIPGLVLNGWLGSSVSTAGDVNGDNITDLVLAAPNAEGAGIVYVIFGSREGFGSSFNLTNLNGTNGFTVPAVAAGGRLGISVSTAGDINGDNITDLVLGSNTANANTGVVYVIFGSRREFGAIFDLRNLNGTNGFTVPGVASGGSLGWSVSTAGDINADNISDLVLGANYATSLNGIVYVIFGSSKGFASSFNLNSLNGANGFTVPGVASGGRLGWSVSMAGDINGDAISDLVLGARYASSNNGMAYVIFGTRGGFTSPFNLNNLNGTNGFMVPGVASSGYLGASVSTLGDINGDTIADLGLGASTANTGNGMAYVIFGTRGGFGSSVNLNALNGSNGFMVPGLGTNGNGRLAFSLGTAGDINGDNIADFILGDTDINFLGSAYVIFGGLASITLLKNQLAITNGKTSVLTSENLKAIGLISFDSLVFRVSQVQGGQFAFLNDSATAIFNFTQAQTNNGEVQFISDRSGPVAYQVGMVNATDNRLVLPFTSAKVNFTNYLPVVINSPSNQQFIHDRPFNFTFLANETFNDSDGDPLTFAARSQDGSPLPSWMQFTTHNNQLTFSGVPPFLMLGTSQLSLLASDSFNATAETNFNVTFINSPPQVINPPTTQIVVPNEPFNFVLTADKIFTDPDGDPLSYSAQLSDDSVLPSWMQFDANEANQLIFSGKAPYAEGTQVRLFAKDPLNDNISATFEILAVFANTTSANTLTSTAQIAGSVVGGILGLAAIVGTGFGFWRYTTDKSSRKGEQFADLIRSALNLKEVNNFAYESGQKYLTFVHALAAELRQGGIDPKNMRPAELSELANDVAAAARNKIRSDIDCLGRSEITVTDLVGANIQKLVAEVQAIRAGQGNSHSVVQPMPEGLRG